VIRVTTAMTPEDTREWVVMFIVPWMTCRTNNPFFLHTLATKPHLLNFVIYFMGAPNYLLIGEPLVIDNLSLVEAIRQDVPNTVPGKQPAAVRPESLGIKMAFVMTVGV
jgi:hypothetical protein